MSSLLQFDESVEQSNLYDDLSLYLPLEMRNPDENQYLQIHVNSFADNQNKNNDYALLALHQIFIFVTYGLLFNCLQRNSVLINAVFALAPVRAEEKTQLKNISSLFTLSLLKERSIFDLMEVLDCNIDDCKKQLKSLIDKRNNLAHCNGKICIDFESDFNNYINGLEVINTQFSPHTCRYLLDINSFDFKSTEDVQLDQLKSLLSLGYISQRSLELFIRSKNQVKLSKNSLLLLQKYTSIY